MTVNGTITEASPPSAPSGQYNVRYQDITITDELGKAWYGRIGSRQGYQANTPIVVTVEEKDGQDGKYNYFRKLNPQYGSQAPPQPAGGQKSQNAGKSPDWDAIAEGKVRTLLVEAGIQSGQIKIDPNNQIGDLEYWKNYCMTGRAPLPPEKDDIPY